MDKLISFFKVAIVMSLVLGTSTRVSIAGPGDNIELPGFHAEIYFTLHPHLERKYKEEVALPTTTDPNVYEELKSNWALECARKSLINKKLDCLPWLYGSPHYGLKALAQFFPQLEEEFKSLFKGYLPSIFSTETQYVAAFALYLQERVIASLYTVEPLQLPIEDCFPEPNSYDFIHPWYNWEKTDDGGEEESAPKASTKYASIGPMDSYFAAKGKNHTTSARNFTQILQWRSELVSKGGTPVTGEIFIDPANPQKIEPNKAHLPKGLKNFANYERFYLFADRGDGLCGFHALGISPMVFVEECIRRLTEGSHEEIEEVISHVWTDLKSMKTRFEEMCTSDMYTDSQDCQEHDNIYRYLFGIDTLAYVDDKELIKLLYNVEKLGKEYSGKLSHTAYNSLITTLGRKSFDLKKCLQIERIINYLRIRYTGLDGFEILLNGGNIEAENIELIAKIAGVKAAIITESLLPGETCIHKDVFVERCTEVLTAPDSKYREGLLKQLTQFIWEIRTFQEDIANPKWDNLQFVDPASANAALKDLFEESDEEVEEVNLVTKFPGREDVLEWLGTPGNAQKFVEERFGRERIRLAQWSKGTLNQNHDPIVQNKGWVTIPEHTLPSLGENAFEVPYLEPISRVEYRYEEHPGSEKTVFLYLKDGHYSTLLPLGITYDTFGEASYIMQMVLEELHQFATPPCSVSRESFDTYIKRLKSIYPDDEVDLASMCRVDEPG